MQTVSVAGQRRRSLSECCTGMTADSLRMLYRCVVTAAALTADDVSARLVVDGQPYRESLSSYAQLSRQLSNGQLERELVLKFQAGEHVVSLQVMSIAQAASILALL